MPSLDHAGDAPDRGRSGGMAGGKDAIGRTILPDGIFMEKGRMHCLYAKGFSGIQYDSGGTIVVSAV